MQEFKARGIKKSYGGQVIVQGIDLYVRGGETVCLLGKSGVGKSTLFHVLSGLEQPDSGQVLLDGQDITGKAGTISYMLQKDLLLPYQTILDNVALPLRLQGMAKRLARAQAADYFADFGLLGCEKQYPHQLSGGMRQRAAFLRTYLFSSQMMLLDEPFSALDAITKKAMHRWFAQIRTKIGCSTIFITHDIDEAILLSDRVLVMAGRPGSIVHEVTVDRHGKQQEAFELSTEYLEIKKAILTCMKSFEIA